MSLAISAAPWTNDNISNTNSNTTRRRIPNMRRTLKQSNAYSNSNSNNDKQISTSNNDLYSSIDIYDQEQNKMGKNVENRIEKENELGGVPANMYEILNKINRFEGMESNNDLADFNPPPKPELNQKKTIPIVGSINNENFNNNNIRENFENTNISSFDVPMYIPSSSQNPPSISKISAANDLGLYANYKHSYEPKGDVGFFSGGNENKNNLSGISDKLTEKINYIIHMLEAQQHEKTNNVMEEVILYTFLGIFIIFICDTFALVGKYHR